MAKHAVYLWQRTWLLVTVAQPFMKSSLTAHLLIGSRILAHAKWMVKSLIKIVQCTLFWILYTISRLIVISNTMCYINSYYVVFFRESWQEKNLYWFSVETGVWIFAISIWIFSIGLLELVDEKPGGRVYLPFERKHVFTPLPLTSGSPIPAHIERLQDSLCPYLPATVKSVMYQWRSRKLQPYSWWLLTPGCPKGSPNWALLLESIKEQLYKWETL